MGTGKKKIEIKKIENAKARMVTFSKRRQGLFKKAHELAAITGSLVAVLAFSPAGKPFVYGSPGFDAVIDKFMNENGCQDVQGSPSFETMIDEFMNEIGCQQSVHIGGDSGKLLTDERVKEGVQIGGGGDENGGGSDMVSDMFSELDSAGKSFVYGSPSFDAVIDKFMNENGCQDVQGSPSFETMIDEFMNEIGCQQSVHIGDDSGELLTDERSQDGVQIGGGRDEDGGGSDMVLDMFSELEEKMKSCESVEEMMEVKSVMEELRDKVVKRLKSVQEDNFVASLYSSDFGVWSPPDQLL
ncbi:hypothetical protein ACOSQ2_013552 [Xanthoceras sorbifolium]|uniref:MADS-box domain-containing protein n=1 Tax=Xanthoceras sorbifolium TaxID=99658 RepID=A0ABQ8HZP7_9ROSI|nr:hypothetical protein JRO89_XS06G0236400 [Xanthoceras sorbifolium]